MCTSKMIEGLNSPVFPEKEVMMPFIEQERVRSINDVRKLHKHLAGAL